MKDARLRRLDALSVARDRAYIVPRQRRHGFFGNDADLSSFLDEVVTWRDLGYHWHWHRGADAAGLETALPRWALETLAAHSSDERSPRYPIEVLEAGATGDPLWAATQRELVATGTIHNYLRMPWGKKVIEWTGKFRLDSYYRYVATLSEISTVRAGEAVA